MEELENNPEGEAPQPPDGETPQDTQTPRPDQSEAVGPEQPDAASADAQKGDAQDAVTPATAPNAEPSEAAQSDVEPAAESVEAADSQTESAEQPEQEVSPEPQADGADETAVSKGASPVAIDDPDGSGGEAPAPVAMDDTQLMAVLEAVVYVAEEPLTLAQIAAALAQPTERVDIVLHQLIAELEKPEHGIAIREVAGGFKMATKAEHHEAVRSFVKSLKPPMKLSLPALETLAVIAYKQPVTAPEIMEIRGVQGTGVLKTLLDRKLIAVAGRKNVIGKPILYKTTRDFLIQFGLNDVNELPSLKEFEDIRRMAFADNEAATPEPSAPPAAETTQPAESATLEQES